jgi:tetratricopeptide (TPR) repeat protein
MKILPIFILLVVFSSLAFGQNCSDRAKLVAPVLAENTRKSYETKLAEAKEKFDENPNNADAMLWLGRRTAYLGNYRDAVKIFTKGIEKFPEDAWFYRHRGHRLITLRCFDDAIQDLENAAKLVKGKKDEVEPDGLPNSRNIPTSTLQTNIFYHLGLAYYLKADFENALKAFRACEKLSKNPDMLVATHHWLYMTLRRLTKPKEADRTVTEIEDNLDVIENGDYYKLVQFYQGKRKADFLEKEIGTDFNTVGATTLGYGLGNWFLVNGNQEKALKIFRQITAGNQWASFGFIAAEAELKR